MQLRLVESPTRELVRRKVRADKGADKAASRRRQDRVEGREQAGRLGEGPPDPRRPSTGAARQGWRPGHRCHAARAVHWADWQLDARTRRVGRAGVAAAKAALEQAHRPEPGTPLSKAS